VSLIGDLIPEVAPPSIEPIKEHLAEAAANVPQVPMSSEQAKDVALMEPVLFQHFVDTAPAPVDVGKLSIPTNVSTCSLGLGKRSVFSSKTLSNLLSRSLVGGYDDSAIENTLRFGVTFHYIQGTYKTKKAAKLDERAQANVRDPF
jgi:hypothetical protein